MMMKIGVYGRAFGDSFIPYIQELFTTLGNSDVELSVYHSFLLYLKPRIELPDNVRPFTSKDNIASQIDCLFSIGGDGTFLNASLLLGKSDTPILGINTGRLGFLSSIAKEDIGVALQEVLERKYTLEQRTLLELDSPGDLFDEKPYALNELTIHKKDSSSMITIHTYLNNQFLNSYWADGLILATPTGSTAYSLSCGGPIILPTVESFILTPIAPHNLNVRPIVIPDTSTVTLRVEGRGREFLASLDSRSETIDASFELTVRKADYKINLIQLKNESFLNTMRNKLMWGIDRRN